MDIVNLRAQIEAEARWREDEVRSLANLLAYATSDGQKATLLKTLVVMLYSHYEGFCKNALSIYLDALNRLELEVRYYGPMLAAAAVEAIFEEMEHLSNLPDTYKDLGDAKGVRRQLKRARGLGELRDARTQPAKYDPETMIHLEGNVTPIVLRKVLCRLGLEYDFVDGYEGEINELLRRRNDYAHGTRKRAPTVEKYRELRAFVQTIQREVTKSVIHAAKTSRHTIVTA